MSDELKISIVMPIYNGAVMLGPTLEALACQSLPPAAFELIMIDDGSKDDPAAVVARAELPFAFQLIQQANAGLAKARNRGLALARADLVMLLDQDIIAAPDLLQAHCDCHARHPRALVAGHRVPWPPARSSPVTQILDLESNHDIPAETLAKHPYQVVLGANFSMPRGELLAMGGFDEAFPAGGGFEDVDFAYRAYRHGLQVVYCAEAVGSHNHPKDLAYVCDAARRYTRCAELFFDRHPELRHEFPFLIDKWPIRWGVDRPGLIARKLIQSGLATPPAMAVITGVVNLLEKRAPNPRFLRPLYWNLIGSYQLIGIREGHPAAAKKGSTRP